MIEFYKKRGFLKTVYRILEHPYQTVLKSRRILIYAEMSEIDDSVLNLPLSITIDAKKTYSEAVQIDMQKMVMYWEKEREIEKTQERFRKGAVLWVLRLNGNIVSFVWSIKGKVVTPWYLPLTPHDAFIFDAITFEEYRGQGLYPLLMNYILARLRLEGVSRAVAELYAWNKSSINGLKKTCYRKFGEARKLRCFGKNITIWSQ